MKWNLIIEPFGRSGTENMSIDCALLRAVGQCGSLRFYRWNPPCLSFGRNEPVLRRYNVEKIKQLGLSVVRRPTGGRAVWHDVEVTYSVVAPTKLFGSLRETYRSIHDVIASALRKLGVAATVAARPADVPSAGAGACFASPARGEVLVGGRKLVGSAQLREGERFLQHGSILLENGQDFVATITNGAALDARATSLREALGNGVQYATVCQAIADEAAQTWGGDWKRISSPSASEHTSRFSDPRWTWRR